MTETRAVYHAPPDGRGVAWLTTTQLAAIVYNELRGLMDDAANRMPPTAGHMDTDRLAALRTDLSMALACTYRLEDAIAQVEQCNDRRGMLADIGPARLVTLRRIELYDALDELTSLMPPTDEGMTEQTLRKMRHRCGAVVNLLYQCSEAVATRDGMGNCQSIGPDVLVQR